MISFLQVCVNLNPLNVCMSYQQTLRLIDKLSEDHDVNVKFWAEELTDPIDKPLERVSFYIYSINICSYLLYLTMYIGRVTQHHTTGRLLLFK